MVSSRSLLLATLSAITIQQGLTQTTFTVGADGCSGLSSNGHYCPGSVIGAGSDSAICCAGDPNLDLINAAGGVSVNIGSNRQNIGNAFNGPSNCTAGTSTAFDSFLSTASSVASRSSDAAIPTTSVNSSGHYCVTVMEYGIITQHCNGGGESVDTTLVTSVRSTTPTDSNFSAAVAATGSSSSDDIVHNAVAAAAPLLAGVVMGLAAVL